jgi:hypothetical protein
MLAKSKNINRVYEILVQKGLFNSYTVLIAWGRLNVYLKQKVVSFDSFEDAMAFAEKKIHKRLNSQKRIGVNYIFD